MTMKQTDTPRDGTPDGEADTLAHRAAAQAFPPTPVQAGSPWERRHTTPDAAAVAARALFAHVNPAVPASYAKVLCPPLHPFFAPAVVNPPDDVPLGFTLAESVANGWPLFLQGAAIGVGARTLAATYADQFNQAAFAEGDPRRVLYVELLPETRSVRHFMDALAVGMGAPLTTPEIRFRSPNYLALRLLATAAQLCVTTIVVARIQHLAPSARAIIAALLQALNPARHVPLHGDPVRPRLRRTGVILVDHEAPEALFAGHPDAIGLLEGRHAVLRPYTTVAQVGQALELAGVGIAPGGFRLDDAEDCEMAERILELTSGLLTQMNPFLARLGMLARHTRTRPNPVLVDAVIPYHRRMIELVEQLGDTVDNRNYETRIVGRRNSRRPWLAAGASNAEHQKAAERAAAERAARESADDASPQAEDDAIGGSGRGAGSNATSGQARGKPRRRRTGKRTRAEVLAKKRGDAEQTSRIARTTKRRGYTNP
jgi:hypothetical protein